MPSDPYKLTALMTAALPAPDAPNWDAQMRAVITRGHLAAWMAGTAERLGVPLDSPLLSRQRLSKAERAEIKAIVDEQLRYLRGFERDRGAMSEAQIAARSDLYPGALKATWYGARWGDWDIPDTLMPGNQACITRCLCSIAVKDHGDGTGTLTRTMGATERHCTECPPLQGDHPVTRKGAAATKHMPGGHDQRSHGRSTARRRAARAAYRDARAGGASIADARAAARAAGLARQGERDARLARMRGRAASERGKPAAVSGAGDTTRAYGADPNKSYELQHHVVDMKDIQASNTASGGINPHYDPSLQPRDRSRAASQAQIDQVARQMNPDVLATDFHRIDAGSPIIDAHGNVLSGNGRTLALQRAQELYPEQYAAYRARIRAEAERLGIDPHAVDQMEHPVLVRKLKGDTDPAAFAREANSSGTLRMSPLEQAKVDAGVLQDKQVLKLHVDEGHDIDRALRSPDNKPFVHEFLTTIPENERANLLTRNGDLNQMGLYRIKAAIYTKAFPGASGERMAESMLESLDPDVKTIQNGISGALPSFSRATSLTRSGARDPNLDISGDLAHVVDTYARIKDNPHLTANTRADQLVAKYLGQSSMFGKDLTHDQERLLVHIDKISRRPTAIRDFLHRYSQIIEDQPMPGQSNLFGDMGNLTKSQLIDALIGSESTPQAQAQGAFL